MERFLDIYETMLGLREAEAQVPGVEDAFEEGQVCAVEYEKMRLAYERLCRRLEKPDDSDLDAMVDSLEKIQKELCWRMYLLRI